MRIENRRARWLTISASILLAWGVLSLAVLEGLPYRSENRAPVSYRLAFVNGDPVSQSAVSEYWQKCIAGIQAAARDKNVAISLMSLEADKPYSSLADIYDSAILAQMDGIICVGFDQQALGEKIDNAAEQGIPTVCVDGDVPGSKRVAYVGTDNYKAGVQAAQALLALSPEPGRIYVVYPGYHTPQFSARAQGFIDTIAQLEGYSVSVAEDPAAPGQWTNYPGQWTNYIDITRTLLRTDGDITALFCPGTSVAVRIARVVLEEGLRDRVRVVCMDDYEAILQAIGEGLIDVTIVQSSYAMGYLAVCSLCGYLDGETHFPEDGLLYTQTYSIDQSNVASYLADGGKS